MTAQELIDAGYSEQYSSYRRYFVNADFSLSLDEKSGVATIYCMTNKKEYAKVTTVQQLHEIERKAYKDIVEYYNNKIAVMKFAKDIYEKMSEDE